MSAYKFGMWSCKREQDSSEHTNTSTMFLKNNLLNVIYDIRDYLDSSLGHLHLSHSTRHKRYEGVLKSHLKAVIASPP